MKLPSHLVSLLGNRTYLRTSREALGKRISVAQARFQRQSGHANGARVPITLFREYRKSYRLFLCFGRRHAYVQPSNLVSLPGIHTHLHAPKKVLHKGPSVAQGLFQKQRKHANGTRGRVTLFRTCKENYLLFLCFLATALP